MTTKNEIAATLTRAQALAAGVIDANAATEVVTTNSRKQYGFTRKMLPKGLPEEPKLYIYSISEYGDDVNLGPGFPIFRIEPCPSGEAHGPATVINPIYFFEEAKVDVTEHTFQSGQEMVDAILRVGPGMNAAWDRRKVGWFVSSHNPPKSEEIKKAVDIYIIECKKLLQEADRFSRQGKLLEINETHRRAAAYLKQKVDWDKPALQMQDCPGCGESVRKGVIWHATPQGCGYVFDIKAYKEHIEQFQVRSTNPAA